MRRSSLVILLALAACAPKPAEEHAPPAEAAATAGPVLPFVADDYPAALAMARERDVPIFVDSWAPW